MHYRIFAVSLKYRKTVKDMKTFKNTKFTTRDYEATQVVFCQAETAPNEFWVECSELEIYRKNCTQLYKAGDQTFFGYL